MTLKTCPAGHKVTTKNAWRVARTLLGLWFTCPYCQTTLILRPKQKGGLNEKEN